MERFKGTTRLTDGHVLETEFYPADSYENAQHFKEQLSSVYQAQGYTARQVTQNTWMGIFKGKIIGIMAEQDSALGVTATLLVSAALKS